MFKLKKISEFINESESNDLHKCYLALKLKNGHQYWSYKKYASDKFFIPVTEDNIDEIELDFNLPILNYSSEITKKMLDKGCKPENVYNKPEHIKISGSKKKFHEYVGEDENLPTTVYTQSAAIKIGFPIIAKPTDGHSGIGIQVFKNKSEFDKADHSKFDIYSQFIDKKSEHRFINFKGNPIFWMERKPMNDKAKAAGGKADEAMNFEYTKKDVSEIPSKYLDLIKKYTDILKDLPYICFDVMEDKKGKLYIIESNSMPGVPFDSTVEIYKNIFNDFYGRPVNKETEKKLDEYAKEMIKRTLDSDDYGGFKTEV